MILYILTDENGLVIEACPDRIKGAKEITCDVIDGEKIMAQWDCVIEGDTIKSLTEGQNALRVKESKAAKEIKLEKEKTEAEVEA